MTSITGIVLALVLLMALAYRGVSVLLLAPLMALSLRKSRLVNCMKVSCVRI